MSKRNYYQLEAATARATMRCHSLQARAFMAKPDISEQDEDFARSYVRYACTMRDLARSYDRMTLA